MFSLFLKQCVVSVSNVISGADLLYFCKFQQTKKGPVFYAVAHGHKIGVFKTWEECQEATKDFKESRKRAHSSDDVTDGVEEKSAKKEKKADA
ncbi:hypothetical protein X798_01109 [Onchocerca flexuosa]|uniref:Ribonuclease H1 N-terminal domain-containing protein n=1 Tax=Onchocerca flexuosa TaxID=387005 RepID=A0A238C4U7_9BILA|nr:hypothetical protein X798_01109 [Onchocerca flexuosa]